MKYQLIFHPQAEKEYAEAHVWYDEKKQGLGERFENMVQKQIEKISDNPEIFGFVKGAYREALIDVFPYTLVYKINKQKKTIYISAIYHTSRNSRNKYRRMK